MKKGKTTVQESKIEQLKRIAAVRRFPAKRLREFLVGLANTRTKDDDNIDIQSWERFVRSFREFFPATFPATCLEVELSEDPHDPISDRKGETFVHLEAFRDWLLPTWCELDQEVRDWQIHQLRRHGFYLTADPKMKKATALFALDRLLPPRDGLQQALIYLGRRARSARVCGRDDCDQEKYFLASQPNQRYCTDVCALEVQRKRKRGAWEDYGKDWREKRKKGTKR